MTSPVYIPQFNSNRYTKGEFIGSGSYGYVYKGFDQLNQKNVAIKCFLIDGYYKFAYRELKVLGHVRSHYLLDLIDANIIEKEGKITTLCLIMPLVEFDLHSILHKEKLSFTFEAIIKIMYQILKGLQYLGDAGIIHRDLKPSNVGINRNYDTRILDFGQSREEHEVMTEKVQVAYYRAIEVCCIKKYSSAIDIWSAGCIFSELFTKKVLFMAKTEVNQIREIVKITGIPTDNPFEVLEEFRFIAPKYNNLPNYIKKDITNFVCQPSQQYGNAKGAENVIKLICSMLELIPQKRPTPLHAMNCELFNQYYDLVKHYPTDRKAEQFHCEYHCDDEKILNCILQDKIREEINRIHGEI